MTVLTLLPLAGACSGDHQGRSGTPQEAGALRAEPSGEHLLIATDNGLRLRPADGRRVTVDDRVEGHWSHRGTIRTLDLSCDDRTDGGHDCPRMPYVEVPDGLSITVTARNAGVDVAGVSGALDVTTVNGDVTVTRSGNRHTAVRLATRNGSVRATALGAQRLHAETTNGDVTLGCAAAPSRVTATTVNGSVDVTVPSDSPAYRIAAATDNGRVTTSVPTSRPDGNRAMTLTTVNGDVDARRD
ncbi:DUF4097 family beta strand repeat-containing protein [Streptomyces sp. NBC_00285]|uniref:DUF4097 family beta strand repeat-containing protein n=1 Tax=Streptomyces sp. NBC_00285 TaxID=2975700 RepID=UPI002E2A04FF|nr:DUF4097 family beta strand repeat-containing protein [Streptomyces sp. NBC_00285]